jgi:hypothetical protein
VAKALHLTESAGGELAVVVAVKHHLGATTDPGHSEEPLHLNPVQGVPAKSGVKLRGPGPADGPRDVAKLVGAGIDIDLD